MRDVFPSDPRPAAEAESPLEGASTWSLVLRVIPLVLLTEVATLEVSLVFPALPKIVAEFRTPSIGWVLTVVTLVGVVAQPLLGKVADAIGKKRMILYAAGVFCVGSVICALADDFGVLLVGRGIQGVVFVVAPASYGLIRDIFPARHVPVAMGAITTGLGFSALTGPLVGGALSDAFGFRAVFWFCLIYAAALTPFVMLAVPESRVRLRRHIDVLGGLLLGLGAVGVLLAIAQGATWGWTSTREIATAAGGCAALILFVVWELRVAEPLIDVRLVAGPAMRWTLLATFGGALAIGGQGFVIPLFAQAPKLTGYGFGMTAFTASLFLVPQGVMSALCGPLGGLLARRRAPRDGLLIGLFFLMSSSAFLVVQHAHVWHFVIAALLQGIGFGFFTVSLSNLVVEAVPATHTGVGAGLQGVGQNLGSATGVTVLGAVLAQYLFAGLPPGGPVLHTESGFTRCFMITAAGATLGLLIAVFMRGGRTPATGGAGTEAHEPEIRARAMS